MKYSNSYNLVNITPIRNQFTTQECEFETDIIIERTTRYNSFYIGTSNCRANEHHIARLTHTLDICLWSFKVTNSIPREYMLVDEYENYLYTIHEIQSQFSNRIYLVKVNAGFSTSASNKENTMHQLKRSYMNGAVKSIKFYNDTSIAFTYEEEHNWWACIISNLTALQSYK